MHFYQCFSWETLINTVLFSAPILFSRENLANCRGALAAKTFYSIASLLNYKTNFTLKFCFFWQFQYLFFLDQKEYTHKVHFIFFLPYRITWGLYFSVFLMITYVFIATLVQKNVNEIKCKSLISRKSRTIENHTHQNA